MFATKIGIMTRPALKGLHPNASWNSRGKKERSGGVCHPKERASKYHDPERQDPQHLQLQERLSAVKQVTDGYYEERSADDNSPERPPAVLHYPRLRFETTDKHDKAYGGQAKADPVQAPLLLRPQVRDDP